MTDASERVEELESSDLHKKLYKARIGPEGSVTINWGD